MFFSLRESLRMASKGQGYTRLWAGSWKRPEGLLWLLSVRIPCGAFMVCYCLCLKVTSDYSRICLEVILSIEGGGQYDGRNAVGTSCQVEP